MHRPSRKDQLSRKDCVWFLNWLLDSHHLYSHGMWHSAKHLDSIYNTRTFHGLKSMMMGMNMVTKRKSRIKEAEVWNVWMLYRRSYKVWCGIWTLRRDGMDWLSSDVNENGSADHISTSFWSGTMQLDTFKYNKNLNSSNVIWNSIILATCKYDIICQYVYMNTLSRYVLTVVIWRAVQLFERVHFFITKGYRDLTNRRRSISDISYYAIYADWVSVELWGL